MKSNKKAILGMLVAIVMSLGMMIGINKNIHDSNLQQVGIGCAVVAGCTENGTSAGFAAASGYCLATASNLTSDGIAATVASGGAASANPVGATYWVVTGVIAL